MNHQIKTEKNIEILREFDIKEIIWKEYLDFHSFLKGLKNSRK